MPGQDDSQVSVEESDDEIMRRVAGGDHRAFTRIVKRYQPRAWSVAMRYCGNQAAAQDIVQDTFLRVLQYAGRYRPEGRFPAWFFRILTNRALDDTSAGPVLFVADPPDPPGPQGPPELLDAARRNASVERALRCLPETQRMALLLKYSEGMGYDEIAQVMNTSPKAVERLLARGREKLARLLAALR